MATNKHFVTIIYYLDGVRLEKRNLSVNQTHAIINKMYKGDTKMMAVSIYSNSELTGDYYINTIFNPYIVLDHLSNNELINYCRLNFILYRENVFMATTVKTLENILYKRCGMFYVSIENANGTIDTVHGLSYHEASILFEKYEYNYTVNRVTLYCNRIVILEWAR